eukprot:1102814-Karenia_brevis.AAC.1
MRLDVPQPSGVQTLRQVAGRRSSCLYLLLCRHQHFHAHQNRNHQNRSGLSSVLVSAVMPYSY